MSRWLFALTAIAAILLFFAIFVLDRSAVRIKAAVVAKDAVDPDGKEGDGESSKDAFVGRRLRPFQRDGIVIPERSVDSRNCDDFEHAQPCNASDGYVACFEYLETRHSLRVCVHLAEPLTVHDEKSGRTFVLPANESPSQGYCLREQVARDVRNINAAEESAIGRARRECSVFNADWLLVRRRTRDGADNTFNFVCRCKYPHLMTNIAGPMSACARDIACNGHGRLNADARESRADPFVNGRCLCEEGWIAEYDARGSTGPYCREATFGEWPSSFFGAASKNPDDLELYHDAVDENFRRAIEFSRLDKDEDVWLPNPCSPCPLVRSTSSGAYFCGDRLNTTMDADGRRQIVSLGIGVRQERDYLRGNGGRLPNACLIIPGDAVESGRVLSQYMSQEWNDGTQYAQEWGFFVRNTELSRILASTSDTEIREQSESYSYFKRILEAPRNVRAVGPDWGVLWTYNHREMLEHRIRVSEDVHRWVVTNATWYTDLCYYGDGPDGDVAWYDFPFYKETIPFHAYYAMPRDSVKRNGFSRQQTYRCPDLRGLDSFWPSTGREIDEGTAEALARAMLPVCLIKHVTPTGDCFDRPELNIRHDNPTGCVLFDATHGTVQYTYILWHPGDMNALHFTQDRNVSTRQRSDACGGLG